MIIVYKAVCPLMQAMVSGPASTNVKVVVYTCISLRWFWTRGCVEFLTKSSCVWWPPTPNSTGWGLGGLLTCYFSFVPLILRDLYPQNKRSCTWADFSRCLPAPTLETRSQVPISCSNFGSSWALLSGDENGDFRWIEKDSKNWKRK